MINLEEFKPRKGYLQTMVRLRYDYSSEERAMWLHCTGGKHEVTKEEFENTVRYVLYAHGCNNITMKM